MSGAWRFDLIPFYYEAVGEGYCVGSEGDALNKIIQFTIPDEFKESRYEMKRFCGKWCHYEAQYSGFQIHNNTLTQELDCQCLIGNGEKVANAINDGSGEYLQCFSFISPSVIDDFQFKGYGGCMDADFQNYDRVEHVKVTSLEDCRTICLESSGSKKLAGLEYDNPTMNCYCQFADKQGPVGPVDHDYVNTACYAFSQFIPKVKYHKTFCFLIRQQSVFLCLRKCSCFFISVRSQPFQQRLHPYLIQSQRQLLS